MQVLSELPECIVLFIVCMCSYVLGVYTGTKIKK